jgi:hypothetical protein
VRLLHAVELERLTLGRKLGFELLTAKEIIQILIYALKLDVLILQHVKVALYVL